MPGSDGDFGSPSLSPYQLPQMQSREQSGVLEVHVQCADGLRAADSNGKSDPYAKVRVATHPDPNPDPNPDPYPYP